MQRYVYLFYRFRDGVVKIGKSIDYESRFYVLHRSSAPFRCVAVYRTDDHTRDERMLHQAFKHRRVGDEYFLLDLADFVLIDQLMGLENKEVPRLPPIDIRRKVVCVRCGAEWHTKLERPATCAICNSYKWDKPRSVGNKEWDTRNAKG